MEDCQQAKRLCEQALLLDPDFCAALYMLAAMCEWLAAYSETPEIFIQTGIDCARRALAINSSFGDIYMILSILYFRQDKFDLAFRAAEQAVKISPNHPNNLVIFANCLADDGRAEEALTLMQKALRLNPLPPAWYFSDLGYIYLCAHQYAAAIAALQECLRCKPDHIKAHRYLTMVYAEAGRKDEARAQAREVLKLNPHFSITKHLSWWLQLAKTPEEREQRRQRLLDAGLLP
jgi:tetratricopeptide (TPR) repeat protein